MHSHALSEIENHFGYIIIGFVAAGNERRVDLPELKMRWEV